jgi:hypothetical protein
MGFKFWWLRPVEGFPWRCESCGNGCGYTIRSFPSMLWFHWWSSHRFHDRIGR